MTFCFLRCGALSTPHHQNANPGCCRATIFKIFPSLGNCAPQSRRYPHAAANPRRDQAMTIERMRDIHAFVHVAEAKSFTAAAERIGLSRAAGGKTVLRLAGRV